MDFSFQECYQKFAQSYGIFQNWPTPYAYLSWFQNLNPQYQLYYLHPTNYCSLYAWTQQKIKIESQAQKKPSRSQKRKLKKKALQEEYNKQVALIGKWVQKERRDLIVGIQKIEQQQRKRKQRKQNKLSYLIQIHKQVYKHQMKKKASSEMPAKRVNIKNKKKRISVIKKMKQIFQSKNAPFTPKKQGQKQKLSDETHQVLKTEKSSQEQTILQQHSEYQDATDSQNQNENKKSLASSALIQEIHYKHIGKLAGQLYNGIPLRQWVTNVPNLELEEITLKIVNRLSYKQSIKKINTPQKARKILVSGLKQCKRTLTTILENKKSKCLIVALNIQRNNLVKGVDDQIQKCIELGRQNKLPVIHVSTRSKLGRAFTGKFGPRLSIVSIINYEGYKDYFDELIQKWKASCEEYNLLP